MQPYLKAGILSVSPRASKNTTSDKNGLLIKSLIEALPADVIAYRRVACTKELLVKNLIHITDILRADLILTIGGIGISSKDQTPEATKAVIQKEIPGISEAIRLANLKKGKFAIFSRAIAGIRKQTLIVNLPDSTEEIEEAFTILKPIFLNASEWVNVSKPQTMRFERGNGVKLFG